MNHLQSFNVRRRKVGRLSERKTAVIIGQKQANKQHSEKFIQIVSKLKIQINKFTKCFPLMATTEVNDMCSCVLFQPAEIKMR